MRCSTLCTRTTLFIAAAAIHAPAAIAHEPFTVRTKHVEALRLAAVVAHATAAQHAADGARCGVCMGHVAVPARSANASYLWLGHVSIPCPRMSSSAAYNTAGLRS